MSKRVIVAVFSYAHEAELQLVHLRSAGIDAQLIDGHTIAVDPVISAVLGGVKIDVPSDELDQAKEILAQGSKSLIVFRESVDAGIGRTLIAVFVSIVVGVVMMTNQVPAPVSVGVMFAIPLFVWFKAGREDRCSMPSCHAKLTDAPHCSGCSGEVVDTLRPGENHLMAEERWLAEHGKPER